MEPVVIPRTSGRSATIYRVAETTDIDGNPVTRAVKESPHVDRVTTYSDDAGAVDSPGAQTPTHTLRANCSPNLPDVALGSIVYLDGLWYDMDADPVYQHSLVPALRHTVLTLSLRQSGQPQGW